jgi:Flp pilus assembly protein TadB
MNDDDLKKLWKSQPASNAAFAMDQLKRGAQRFQRRVAARNALEYLACVAVVACFANYLVVFPFPVMRAGSVLLILGTVLVAWQLHKRASNRGPLPGELGERPWLEFHLRQLTRQRDALRNVWLWYVAPFVPGIVVFRWGVETELGISAPFARGWTANLSIAAVFLLVIAYNRFVARRLQKRIDQLQQEAAE